MKKTIILLIIILIICSSVGFAKSDTNSQKTIQIKGIETSQESTDIVLWDNDMNYYSMASAQFDASINLDSFQGDDCRFTETKGFTKVKWIGGYWNTGYQNAEFSWGISFYRALGGQGPNGHPYSPDYYGPYIFQWNELEKNVITDTGSQLYYEITATLPEKIYFGQNTKYYISIWGIGQYPPQSGWAYHNYYKENPAFFGSNYYNFPFWTASKDAIGFDLDMCFQLIYENIGDLDCIGDLNWNNVPKGSEQVGFFQVKNCDSTTSYLDWEIAEWPSWGVWTFNPPSGANIPSGSTHTVMVNVKVPDEKNEEFKGRLKIVNSNNPSDYDTVEIVVSTPKIKENFKSLITGYLDIIRDKFPMIKELIC